MRCGGTHRLGPAVLALVSSPTTLTTMRPIGYLSGSELATLLEQPDAASAVRVVDVRDSDFEGGHIRGATHIPAHQFLANAGAYATRWRGEQRVVFHWYAAARMWGGGW